MRLALLGFGLIGGSIAQALQTRAPDDWSVTAWSPSGSGPRTALRAGVIDRAASEPEEAVGDAELVVLAAPPLECLALLDALGGSMRPWLPTDAVVTDVASTKRLLVERGREHAVRYVGGHPMAGVEQTGYAAASADLFLDRPWVVCPVDADAAAVDRVERLARATGARPTRMDAGTHDAAVAAISHLPLILSAALVESVFGADATGGEEQAAQAVAEAARLLAAGGWRDMTRLARGDPSMGAGIAVTNADQVADRVRALRAVLDDWLVDLDAGGPGDAERIAARFAAVRRLLGVNADPELA